MQRNLLKYYRNHLAGPKRHLRKKLRVLLAKKKYLSFTLGIIFGIIVFWKVISHVFVTYEVDTDVEEFLRIDAKKKHVYIIARAHERQPKREIQAFIHSLLAQTHENFTIWIVNGEDFSKKVFTNEIHGFHDKRVSSLSFNGTKSKQYFHSYGYHTTDLALRKIIGETDYDDRHQFLLVTNADNLYHQAFLQNSLKRMRKSSCIVASDWISRYVRGDDIEPNQVGKVHYHRGGLDLGCAISSLFHIHRSFNRRNFFMKNNKEADWYFFKKILHKFGKDCAIKTNQVLFMHQ